jgi:guanylate kinase
MLLGEYNKEISEVVSHTTRIPRISEIEGVDYHFVNHDTFQNMIQNDQFIEYVECFGHFYGTSISSIAKALETHDVCVMDIEWAGAYKVLHVDMLKDFLKVGILILPPSMKTLRARLRNRKSETEETLNQRICDSFKIKNISKYDHFIVNNDLEIAYKDLKEIYLNMRKNLWK